MVPGALLETCRLISLTSYSICTFSIVKHPKELIIFQKVRGVAVAGRQFNMPRAVTACRVQADPLAVYIGLCPCVSAKYVSLVPDAVNIYQSVAIRDGIPTALHRAAVSTACSVQSPCLLWATSNADA